MCSNTQGSTLTIFFSKNDYNQGAKVVENIPCWEREFELQTFSEEVLINKMKILGKS